MTRKFGSILVLVILIASAPVYGVYEGCFEETVRSRHFHISPGDFRPEITTTKTCSSACGAFDYKYAALAQGKFCFCGNSLPARGTVSDSLCDVYCPAEPSQRCGGLKHVSVHSASKAVAGLSLSSDVQGQPVITGTEVTLDVTIATGMDVIYQFDYDDGAGRTSNNVTGMLRRTYSVPGIYDIQVFANDVNQTFPDSVAVTAVKVEAPPGETEVECDAVFATYEDGKKCTVTVWSGTSLSVAVDVQGFSYTVPVPDPPLSLAGLAVPSKEALTGDAIASSFLLLAAQFSVSGRILAWEMNVETLGTGTIKIGILKPACGNYCYGSNACGGTCVSTSGQSKTCLASEQFCGQAAMCQSSCTPSSRYDDTSDQMTWEVVSVHTVTATSVGYQYIPESSLIEVEAGYILGVQHLAGAAVLGRVTVGGDQPDLYDSATTIAVGNTIDASTANSLTARHALRAVASGGTKVHLPFIFTQAGNFTLTATASSTALPSSPTTTASTNVIVEEGVNLAIISSAVYVKTSQPTPFEVEPHTGNNVLYNWTLSDGTERLQSTDRILTHTFTTRGQYQVNVSVYNSVSFKENTTDVVVEDEITGLAASTAPTALGTLSRVTLSFTGGSDFSCTVDFGDGTAIETATEAELSVLSNVMPHLYLSANTYQVSVTCANNVSSLTVTTQAIVQSAITNLRMTSEGANKFEDFYIRWEVDAGTDIAFNLTFDGNLMTSITEYATNKWQTDLQNGRSVSEIPLILTASNMISSASININFKILTAIVNPTFTSATINASSGDMITFTANMQAGSDTTVTISYRDGTSDSYVQTPSTDWAGPQTFTHSYHNGGNFDVMATFSNAEATYYRYHMVSVQVGVQNIRCELPEFALYHPPAEANLTFIGEALPTDPILTINWGEQQSRDTVKTLVLNTTYPHKFGDTGVLNVVTKISNIFGTKWCNKTINIVEKLVNPHFQNAFLKAGKNLPFEVSFCLHRGPSFSQCNLTFDFGNGEIRKIERAGEGQDGCDRQTVTYTDTVSRTITVTADTLLETDSASIVVDVIDGFQDSDISVTDPATVTFTVPSVFEVEFTGSTAPEANSVQVLIEYGDGTTADNGPHAFAITSTGDKVQIQHVYAYDSTFTAQVTVFSDCCSVVKNVSVGVYKVISNVQADLYYLADIPPNQKTNGLEGNSLLYPTNKALHFNMSNQNDAFVATFDVTVNSGGSVILTCQKSMPEFSIFLNDSGAHTIDVRATNPISQADLSTKSITMYELIQGFTVVEAEPTKVGVFEDKVFNVGFDKVGTDTCVYVDYDDGSKYIYSDNLVTCTESAYSTVSPSNRLALTGVTQLRHSYSTEKYYTVNVLAKNAHSSVPVQIQFSISGLDCSKPTVDIPEGSHVFTEPLVFKMSNIIRIRGVSVISCADSYKNTKSWRAEKINPDTDTVMGTVSLSGLDTSKAEPNIESRFLDLGLYKIYYKMTMDGAYGVATFEAETFTYIRVDPSDLIGVMVRGGVSKVERGSGQNLLLEPLTYSTDPDVDPTAAQGLAVSSWQCVDNDDASQNCDNIGFDSSGVPVSQTLTISAGVIGKTYKISATLTKDTRTVVTEVFLVAVSGTPPFIYIVPAVGSVYYQLSDGVKILQSSRLALDCVCENCLPTDNEAYNWEVYTEDYRWPDNWRKLNSDDLTERVLGQKSKQISIQDALFEVFNSEFMKVECTVTKSSGSGKVSTKLTVNKPPVPGTCSITPLERTITDQAAWTVTVDGWSDVDKLEEFQFFIHTDDDTADKQITSEPSTSGSFSKKVRLSEGPEHTGYEQEIIVKVRDTLQATTVFPCGTVKVLPMPVEQIRALAKNITSNQLHSLKRMFAEGDQKTCSETSTNIVSLLNSDSKRSRKEYAGYQVASNNANSMYGSIDENRPAYRETDPAIIEAEVDYKKETERNDRGLLRAQLISDMSNLNAESVIAIQQVSSFFAEAVVYGDEIDQDSQTTVMNSLGNMTLLLVDPPENVPSEDLEVAMEAGVACIGGIMDAAGSNGFQGTLAELERATGDEVWKEYDTDLDASAENDELAAAADFEEALKIHTAIVHKQRQARTAKLIRKKVMEAMDMQAQCFSRYSVPGQALEMKSRKMRVLMEKTDVKNLEGKTLAPPSSDGEVVLPNTTLFADASGDSAVVVSVGQSTNHPLRYSTMAQGIAPQSNFISINLYNSGNTKMKVNNLPEPVKIVIPRDAAMEIPQYISMDPMIPSWTNLMNFVVEVNRTSSGVFLDFEDIEGRQFLLVVKKGKVAYIDDTNEGCDYVFLMPNSMTQDLQDPYRYRFFLGDPELGDFTGKLYIGIRELNSTEFDMDVTAECSSVPRYGNGTDYFKGNFLMRLYVSQCFAIGDGDEDWSTAGCRVGKETIPTKTVCWCNHMTTFAGGWVVVPNTIDWSYVFANADFLSNPTIYITVIVTAVLFLAAAIYARFNDKKMAEQLGIAPLADNDPRDKYFYEIIVCTGMRRNAGTNSQVCFILSGEDDETDVRAFTDSKRKIFRRGQVDGFLMAVPRPLGYLNFMRVWHDNSGKGKFGSWYLNYIVVRDVQSDTKQVFVANKWLAVEEDDGQVDRVLPVAGKEQLADFSYQFGERSRKNLADGHLWFSVVARPPQSRFTCLQRVSCCLCLLYVTMLTNAMFYNTSGKEEGSNAFSFGPFTVAPEQITIGIISNLIVFPVNFLLIFLFRKSRPHHKRPSRIDRAIKEVHDSSKQTSINDVKPEVNSIFSVSKSPTIPSDPHRPDSARSTSRPATAMSGGSAQELTVKKKKKFELPWYFTIIAWILLWIVTLGALAMVVFYGISFKDETCRKWISSMLVSFFMSVFITQPVKVFLFAIILSIIIKNPSEEKEEEEDDEELPHVDADNELLHADTGYGAARPRKVGYKPPNANQLEKLRQRRIKEIKMWGIIREVIIYSIFLMMLLVISYRQLGASNFLYKDTMHRVFIANNETNIDFHAIRNTKDFWDWTTSGLVNGLRAGAYYNDYPPLKLRAFINDKVSRILGYATMRQLRIKPALCEIPDKIEGLIDQCNKKYSIKEQQEATFKPGWIPMGSGDTDNDTREEYTYTKAGDLNGYPYWGTLAVYSGGGYVVPLIGSKTDLQTKMQQLEREAWIDKYTRAVFIEFTVYNAQVNLFAISTILCEFDPAGGTVVSFRFEPAMLLPYMSDAMLFQIVCEIAYIVFTLFFIVREFKSLIKTRLAYFKNFWNLVEVGIIGMSIATIVIFFYRMLVTNGLTKDFKSTNGNGYIKFQYVGYWNEMFSYMIGFLVFLASLKFLKLLRFNRKISMLSATLRHAAKSLLHFGVIFFIVFLAFSQLFYLTYMHIDVDYSTFISSVVATILMMMGKFNIYSMIMAEPILTQIFVLLFVIMVTFIIVNMFVSILNETFTVVREDVKKQGNDYEVIDFMLQRFKKWTGIGKSPEETQHEDDPNDPAKGRRRTGNNVEDFPDRIERLLQSISTVYMDNDNLTQLYQKKQYDSRNAKDMLRQGATASQFGGPMRIGARKESTPGIPKVHTH